MGDATITTADKFTQLSVEFQNTKASAGELFASLGLLGLQLLKVGKYNDMFFTPSEAPKTFEDPKDPSFFAPSVFFDPDTVKESPRVIESLKDLKNTLADLKKEFELLDITSDEFNTKLTEIIALESRLDEILTPTVDTIELQSKGIHDLGLAYQETNGVVQQFGNLQGQLHKETSVLNQTLQSYDNQLRSIMVIGQELGSVFQAVLTLL